MHAIYIIHVALINKRYYTTSYFFLLACSRVKPISIDRQLRYAAARCKNHIALRAMYFTQHFGRSLADVEARITVFQFPSKLTCSATTHKRYR